MKKTILFFIISLPFLVTGQCFDCAKNMGGWNSDVPVNIKKTVDGIYLLKNSGNFFMYAGLDKYDFNCNLLWSKKFNDNLMYIKDLTYDSNGNIYVLYSWTISSNVGYGPFIHEGYTMNPGLNLYKFDPNGNLIWHRFLGHGNPYNNLNKIYIYNNLLYVVSSHYGVLNVDNQYFFNFPYTNYTRPYICKLDLMSNILDVKSFGSGTETYTSSEMDSNGNIYLSRYSFSPSINSDIDKINSNLEMVWTKQVTSGSVYIITKIFHNPNNNLLYTWGAFNNTVNISGNIFIGAGQNSTTFQSLLGEFNTSDGEVERITRIDNSSSQSLPGIGGSSQGNNAYMANKGNELYVFTSFKGTLNFPNASITSTIYHTNPTLYSEELVLFKVNLSNFTTEFINKSNGVSGLNHSVNDLAGPFLLDNNDLYLTAGFGSNPMLFNSVVFNNNSGNNALDVMLYKYNINNNNSAGQISVENACLNSPTSFNLNGTYNTITWDFGDLGSSDNSSNINNPTHQFSSIGNYHVTALVTCGSQSQLVEKDITITDLPSVNSINPFIECETISGSGICSEFDTSNIVNSLIGSQQNLTIKYRLSNGSPLPSPLPNPYTNINPAGDLITARIFNLNNPDCFVETIISFSTTPKPLPPTLSSTQSFCIQQNATINDIAITGQNIQWYDAQLGGNLLNNSTLLVNGVNYYASQTINGCESERVPVTITIYNTQVPTASANQSFCSTQNATLSDIVISGSSIIWYDDATLSTTLPSSTLLQNNVTYYATQTLNGCQSIGYVAVTINLINTLNASNYSEVICDDLNDGSENINLNNYTNLLISGTGNTFTFYNSQLGAQNQSASELINSNYTLTSGSHTIYVRIDSTNSCYQIVTITLELVAKPIIIINDTMPICLGSSINVSAGNGFDSYLWSTNETTQSIVINQSGNYNVTVTQNHGAIICSSTKNFTVINSSIAEITEIITTDWDYNSITVMISPNSSGDYEYSLDNVHFQESNFFDNLPSGTYTVFVRDKNGCGTVTEEVYLLTYPKYFTPNNDGIHDFWKIKFSELEPNITIKLFDRYGKLLKYLEANSDGWDGNLLGEKLPADDYWFVVVREDGRIHKGHFALKR